MKRFNLNLIFLLFISIGIFSCQEEDRPNEPDFISSNINEVDWDGITETRTFQDNDSLVIFGINNEQDLDHILVLKINFNGEGDYTLNNSTVYYTLLGGDVETSLYRLDQTSTSQFTITEYNSEQNIIKGNFEISLLLEQGDPENYDNKLVLKNGKFKATIDN